MIEIHYDNKTLGTIRHRPEFGLWWPDQDPKSEKCFAFVGRNVADLRHGLQFVADKQVAVQAGGHCGIFPTNLADHFRTVYTFEPDPVLFACLERNVPPGVKCYRAALSDRCGEARFAPGVRAGRGEINDKGDVLVAAVTLDNLALTRLDFLHLDVERHELTALDGALYTIRQYRPVIQLEVLPDRVGETERYMRMIGYARQDVKSRDWVYLPR